MFWYSLAFKTSSFQFISTSSILINSSFLIDLLAFAPSDKPRGKKLFSTLFLEVINLPLEAKPPSPSSISPCDKSFLATDTISALKNLVCPVGFLSKAIE